jgi:rSAM-associated Gly-rich repeat protein
LPQKYLKVVSELAASGAVGAALLLGLALPAAADQEPATGQPATAPDGRVAERLAAIREAVSAVADAPAAADELHLAWGNWRNGGWGGGGWGGGGWGRPWGNFGFGVPWNNWNNWRNGWNNWRNWWRNF